MTTTIFARPDNEPVLTYAPQSDERAKLKEALADIAGEEVAIPAVIDGERRLGDATDDVVMPHQRSHRLARVHRASADDVGEAIDAAMRRRRDWAHASFEERARVFLRAADLIAGPRRQRMNAATMLGQSKTAHQAEIDAACELVDFLRFGVWEGARLHELQPQSPPGVLNTLDVRPLDGFVFAVTPFNFTAIAGNLPSAPALMGNTVVWKPAPTQMRAAHETMLALEAAGLPRGVINLVAGDPATIGDRALASPHLAGLHFTGSAATFQHLQQAIAKNLGDYRCYPRVVGEAGGKDFIVAHSSADRDALVTAIVRGGYEYQGQKCSAASRVFLSRSVYEDIRDPLVETIRSLKVGDPTDFTTFVAALIDEAAMDKVAGYLELAHRDPKVERLAGGEVERSVGHFVQPTLLRVDDPKHRLMTEEIFGPVVTLCVFDDDDFEATLEACDEATPYALTGAIFARDRAAVETASRRLRFAAGNFYVNDKPTGSVVGQQPFGGSRRSGTNDKAGSLFNLARWVSPRAIKETFVPPTDHRYPSMEAK